MAAVIEGPGFRAQLLRSVRRQTLSIQVKACQVIVRAPVALDEARIRRFVLSKSSWVQKHLQRQGEVPAPVKLTAGSRLFYMGQPVLVQPVAGAGAGIELVGHELHVSAHEQTDAALKARLASWYTAMAVTHLRRRVAEFATVLDVRPRGLKVRYYKSRWGSCNRRGELQFNWLIMMAPPAVIDYVVVHELCHLRHFDHSRAFWNLVASTLPDYAQQRQWLKQQTCLIW